MVRSFGIEDGPGPKPMEAKVIGGIIIIATLIITAIVLYKAGQRQKSQDYGFPVARKKEKSR
jgi:hypothetical protein